MTADYKPVNTFQKYEHPPSQVVSEFKYMQFLSWMCYSHYFQIKPAPDTSHRLRLQAFVAGTFLYFEVSFLKKKNNNKK